MAMCELADSNMFNSVEVLHANAGFGITHKILFYV